MPLCAIERNDEERKKSRRNLSDSKSVQTVRRWRALRKKIERSMVKRRIVILREKGNREWKNGGNRRRECVVALHVGATRKGGNRKEGGRTRREKGIEKRRGSEEERDTHSGKGKRQNRRNGSAGLSRTSFIFSPRLNIKDNLIIGGFSHTKAGRAFSRSSLCLSFHLFLSPFSSVCACSAILSVDDMKALEAWQKKTRYMHISLHRICKYSCEHR